MKPGIETLLALSRLQRFVECLICANSSHAAVRLLVDKRFDLYH